MGASVDEGIRRREAEAARGYLAAASAGFIWGLSHVVTKGLLDRGYDAVGLATLRGSLAAVALALLWFALGRSSLRVQRRELVLLVAFGLTAGAVFPYCLFAAQDRAPIGVVVALLYAAPPLGTGLAWLVLREPITRLTVVSLAVSFVGVLLVSGALGGGAVSGAGIGFGLGSAACFAIYMVGSKTLVRTLPVSTMLLLATAIGAAALGIGQAVWWRSLGPAPQLSTVTVTLLALAVLGPTVLARMLYAWSMRSIKTSHAGVLSTLEPVTGAIAAAVVLGQELTVTESIGIAVIISATALVHLELRRHTNS